MTSRFSCVSDLTEGLSGALINESDRFLGDFGDLILIVPTPRERLGDLARCPDTLPVLCVRCREEGTSFPVVGGNVSVFTIDVTGCCLSGDRGRECGRGTSFGRKAK